MNTSSLYKKGLESKGFTMVETLMAIGILVLAVYGSFTAAQSGISSSIFSKDQVIAFYLAAEGVEQVRNVRSNNALIDQNWLTGLEPCYSVTGSQFCTVDAVNTNPLNDQPSVSSCASDANSCPYLQEHSTTGFYGYGPSDPNWVNTPFKRSVSITRINDSEMAVLVRLTWSKGTITRTFDVRENIMDWQ